MTEQNSQTPVACSLKAALEAAERQAKAAEFHKQTATILNELIKKSEKELDSYRNAYAGLKADWAEQDGKIKDVKSRIESCYPDWQCILEKSVCADVICANQKKQQDYLDKLGEPEKKLEQANLTLATAKEQLDAWKDLTKWLSKRLEDNKKLFERICSLDDCKNPLLQLYLFYFLLWPRHCQLAADAAQREGVKPPATDYCGSCPDPTTPDDSSLMGFPWLIAANDYDCQLTTVWKKWCEAGAAQSQAQSDFDLIAKLKKDYQDASTAEALEKAAAEALRKYDGLTPKPCGNDSGKPDQEPESKPDCEEEEQQQTPQQN